MGDHGWFNILQAPSDVDKTPPTDGQVLAWDDSVNLWVPSAAAGGGSIGGTITGGLDTRILFIHPAGTLAQDTAFTFSKDGSNIATLLLGNGDGGTPVNSFFRGPAAAGSSITGANLTFDASNGTGAGGSGNFIFRTAPAISDLNNLSIDATTTAGASNTSSLTWSHTVGTDANRMLLVSAGWQKPGGGDLTNITSVTYNGVNLTRLITYADPFYWGPELWYLLNPPTGAHNVVITYGTSQPDVAVGAATSFFGVNQSSPFNTPAVTETNASPISLTVSSATSDLVYSVLNVGFQDANTPSAGAGQTSVFTKSQTGGGVNCYLAGSTKPGAASVTVSYSSGVSNGANLAAVSIKHIDTTASNVLTEAMRITNTQRVGIGTASPAQMLDISSTAPSFQMTDTTASAKSLRLVVDANVANFYEAAGSAGDILSLDLTNKRVGIGIAAPTYLLTVQKDQNAVTTIQCVNASAGADAQAVMSTYNGTYLNNFGLTSSAYVTVGSLVANQDFFYGNATGGYNFICDASGAPMIFSTYGIVEKMRLTAGGNLGIGVASPTASLHLKASTAAANTASLKIDSGVVATTPVSGNIESDGTHLYWTDSGGTRHQLDN